MPPVLEKYSIESRPIGEKKILSLVQDNGRKTDLGTVSTVDSDGYCDAMSFHGGNGNSLICLAIQAKGEELAALWLVSQYENKLRNRVESDSLEKEVSRG